MTENETILQQRIKELETKVLRLETENERLRNRKLGGRRFHDEKWKELYDDFVQKYESGMTMDEIVADSIYSRRTAYRYKAVYLQNAAQ